jgi:hypothetical protein
MIRMMARLTVTVSVAAAMVVSGCAAGPNAPAPAARWVPSATPSFATLARSTTYALVHAEDRDLLVIEQDQLNEAGDFVVGRLTWLVPLAKSPVFNQPMRVGGRGAEAWVLEEVQSGRTHAAPAEGSVTILGQSADALTVSLNMTATPEDKKAGVVAQPTMNLDGRFEFVRYTPTTPQFREMDTRRGIDPAAKSPLR